MTELIVALDGPSNQYALACNLFDEVGICWFKIGPQLMCSYDWQEFTHSAKGFDERIKIFLDLKLVDTKDTVRESVRRFANAGISALSTFTADATSAAIESLDNDSDLRIWQVMMLSDAIESSSQVQVPAHGIICPGYIGMTVSKAKYGTVTVPGVRLDGSNAHGHKHTISPQACRYAGINYAVVGRPIWAATAPIAVAKLYKEALQNG